MKALDAAIEELLQEMEVVEESAMATHELLMKAERTLAELERFKRDVCIRASTDQHGWSEWVAHWRPRPETEWATNRRQATLTCLS